jgi:hypothetical protein
MINVIGGATQISPRQMRLSQLFTVKRILASRGFQIESEGTATNTLLAKDFWTYDEFNLMFTVFDDITLRKDLLAAIENISFTTSRPEVSNLLALPNFQKDRNKFSTTFEWYVGELLVRKFQAFSSSFGVDVQDIVRNTDNGTAGDFDVLTVLGDMNLLYLECKTGKCTQKSIKNTIERSLALHSLAAVIFLGKGTNENTLKQLLKSLMHPLYSGRTSLVKFNIKSIPDSVVYEWYNCYFVPANETSGTVEVKLRAVMRLLAAHRTAILGCMRPDASAYNSVGYDYTEINF